MTDLFDLTGATAVVTGASRGIGFAMAEALAAAGADIIGVSATLAASGSLIEAAVTGHGRSFTGIATDFADRSAVESLADRLSELRIDILVNNAGTIERAPAVDHPLESWDRVLEVNLSSQFVLTQTLARGMLARGRGKIIFTASLLSFQGGINVPGYAAAKSGIAGLTRALANEWTASGVTVNAIAPGYIATDNTSALRDDPDRSAAILARIPAGRWGDASDLAGATVFLASPASDYVSGIVLPVDGGWLGAMTTVIEALAIARIVPVIVIDDAARAGDLASALIDGGITAVEITLRTPAGLDAMAAMAAHGGMTVGAGTVLTAAQVVASAGAGAQFIVSPGIDDEVIARGQELGLGMLPGIATATEVQRAARHGLSHLKLFPADKLGGLGMIDSLNGPFPDLRFMPSGGVSAGNAVEYLAHPSVFAISGSWMATRAAISAADFDGIRAASAAAMDLAR